LLPPARVLIILHVEPETRIGNAQMMLTVNGTQEQIEQAATIGDLLRRYELIPVRVAVEVNQELVPRGAFDDTPLHDGDAVEIVTFVGGG